MSKTAHAKAKPDGDVLAMLNHLDQNVSSSSSQLAALSAQVLDLVADLRLHLRPALDERQATQSLVDTTPIQGLDPVKEKLRRRGVEAVLSGAEWLKTKEVGERAAPHAGNKHSQVSRWHQAAKIFGIERAGVKYYPNYIFDALGNPIPEVQEVLAVFKDYTAFRVASWFESTSSTLGARRPREVIASDPQAVVEAAKAHVAGALHG